LRGLEFAQIVLPKRGESIKTTVASAIITRSPLGVIAGSREQFLNICSYIALHRNL